MDPATELRLMESRVGLILGTAVPRLAAGGDHDATGTQPHDLALLLRATYVRCRWCCGPANHPVGGVVSVDVSVDAPLHSRLVASGGIPAFCGRLWR